MDRQGYYQKYNVSRVDGKPITGRTFTFQIDTDPDASIALRAYAGAVYKRGNGELARALIAICDELDSKATTK